MHLNRFCTDPLCQDVFCFVCLFGFEVLTRNYQLLIFELVVLMQTQVQAQQRAAALAGLQNPRPSADWIYPSPVVASTNPNLLPVVRPQGAFETVRWHKVASFTSSFVASLLGISSKVNIVPDGFQQDMKRNLVIHPTSRPVILTRSD